MRGDVVFALILAFISTFMIGVSVGSKIYEWTVCQPLAIENGCGQYNSQTGDFEWVKR